MLAQSAVQRFRLLTQLVRKQRGVGEIAHRCGQHAQVLLGNAGKAFKPQRIRGGDDAFRVKQGPIDIEELASGHLAIIGHRGQRVDVLMNDVDELLQFVIGLRPADESFRKFFKRVFLTHMGGQEQHQAKTPVDLATGLERGVLLRTALAFLGIILISAVAVDFRRHHGGAVGAGGFIGRHELRGRMQPAVERVDSLLRAHYGRTRMRQHEHGQIIGVGVGDIEMLAINIHSGGETSLIDHFDQLVGNGLRAKTRRDGIQAKSWNRRLRHARRGTGSVLGFVRRSRGNRHGARKVIRSGKNRQILVAEQQTHARLIAKLQTVGSEILPF